MSDTINESGAMKFNFVLGGCNVSDATVAKIKPSSVKQEETRNADGSRVTKFWVVTRKQKIYDYHRECTAIFYVAVALVVAALGSMLKTDALF